MTCHSSPWLLSKGKIRNSGFIAATAIRMKHRRGTGKKSKSTEPNQDNKNKHMKKNKDTNTEQLALDVCTVSLKG